MPPKGNFPSLLIVGESSGVLHFHVPDEESLHKLALSILTARLTSGQWYPDPEAAGLPEHPGFDATKIPEFPESLRGSAEDLLADYEKYKQEYEADRKQFEQIEAVVRERQGAKAWAILRSRAKNENESVRLVVYCWKYHA
jgi:hypothetical protein